MRLLEVQSVSHVFDQRTILNSISFSVDPGQIVCLLGPSGHGKSTLLYIIAGLLHPTSGKIFINSRDQTNIPTYQRDIGFVFQNTKALFPHLTVYENVAFPFTKGNRSLDSDWKAAVLRILKFTGLDSYAKSSIATLSGGEQQRVALARALVYNPSLLLLDEPLSSVDNLLKDNLLLLMQRLHDQFGTTFLYVTHDEREAIQIATHIAVLKDKHLQQFAPAVKVIQEPATPSVAEIVGGWNLLKGVVKINPHPILVIENKYHLMLPLRNYKENSNVTIGIPISQTYFVTESAPISAHIALPAQCIRVQPWYNSQRYLCYLDNGQRILCTAGSHREVTNMSKGFITFQKEDIYVFTQ